jgi:hypothetical protein
MQHPWSVIAILRNEEGIPRTRSSDRIKKRDGKEFTQVHEHLWRIDMNREAFVIR